MAVNTCKRLVRFEGFELDLRAGELRNGESKVRLPEQPFRILTMLLERPGEVISREEIRKKLWPNDTVVEFEHSISAAMNRLRQALGDSADKPHYIETLARRGYRWMVPVEWVDVAARAQPGGADLPLKSAASPQGKVGELENNSALPLVTSLTGKKVSHYRVLEVLGGGGMGVAYKAEDLKLGRQVALKFLPEELGEDSKALARFEAEARAASALNHPNICTVYEFGEHEGQPFIAMELLEGQTLREVIAGAIPSGSGGVGAGLAPALQVDELLDLATQIAGGLEAAHNKGIIHRDIKPANIFTTTHGQVKILDFGLAKLTAPEVAAGLPRHADDGDVKPPLQSAPAASGTDPHLSKTGVAMGTAPYMSPEQVRGEKLDARTDLFSFGLVLYEMATGQPAFAGKTAAEIHDAILNRPPSAALKLNPQVPVQVERIISRAIEKDPDARYQYASELRADLEGLKRVQGRRRWPAIVTGVSTVLLVAGTMLWFTRRQLPLLPELAQRQLTANSSENPVQGAAISPDGKYLAYADANGIRLTLLEGGETRAVLRPAALTGSQVEWLVGPWFPDGTRFLATAKVPGEHPSIWTVSLVGGEPRKLRDDAFAWSVAPDGSAVAFTRQPGRDGDREIGLMRPDGGQARRLYEAGENSAFQRVQWSPDGRRLAYMKRDGMEFSVESRDLSGGPPVVAISSSQLWDFLWLPDGRMIYSLEEPPPNRTCNLWQIRIDAHTGKPGGKPKRLTNWAGPCISGFSATTDGKRLAFQKRLYQGNVYVADFASKDETRIGAPRRLAWNEGIYVSAWTPDSKAVVFFNPGSIVNGQAGIFKQLLDQDTAQPVITGTQYFGEPRVTPDGAWVLYHTVPWTEGSHSSGSTGSPPTVQIMRVPITGGPPQWVLTAPYSGSPRCGKSPGTFCAMAERSPDGKQLIFSVLDPWKGRGRELTRFDIDDPQAEYYAFDLSPQADRLAVLKAPTGHIDILSLTGQARQSFTVKDYDFGLDWAADGKGLFTSKRIQGGAALLHVDLQGNARAVWVLKGGLYAVGLPSPDGRRLVVQGTTMNSNIWMLEGF